MRTLCLCCLLTFALFVPLHADGIVNNVGNTAADSLSIPFVLLDSTGNYTALASGDSVFLVVFYPNGAVAFEDSAAFGDPHIVTSSRHGFSVYAYKRAVAELDGIGVNGVYSYLLTVYDRTAADLFTPRLGTFQLYTSDDFNVVMDNLDTAVSTRSVFDPANDSVIVDGSALAATANAISSTTLASSSVTSAELDASAVNEIWEFDTTFISTGVGQMLKDTTAYQGAGSSLSAGAVADSVWDELQSNHLTAGTFGSYLDAQISGVSAGAGIYSRTIVIYDSSQSSPVNGAVVAVRNLSQTNLLAVGSSDNNGLLSVNLDADSVALIATAPDYFFAPDTVVISGPGADTLFGYRFDPGAPPSPAFCRVYGFVLGLDGQPESDAAVTAYLPDGVVRTGGSVVSPFAVTTTTDTTGYWQLDLIPSPSLTPTDTQYEITITRRDGTILHRRVTVPNLTTWEFTW